MERYPKKGVTTAKFQDGGLSYSSSASDRDNRSINDIATLVFSHGQELIEQGREIVEMAELAIFFANREEIFKEANRGVLSPSNRELLKKVSPKLKQCSEEIDEILRRSRDK